MTKLTLRFKGGSGSGNFGHKGRKGQIGGSAKGFITDSAFITPNKLLYDDISKDKSMTIEKFPISKISMSDRQGWNTLSDIQDGRRSKTNGSVELVYDKDHGQFLVDDGNHRIIEALRRGESYISAKIYSTHADFRPLYSGEKQFDYKRIFRPKNPTGEVIY